MQKQSKSEPARGNSVFQVGTKNAKRTEISTELSTNLHWAELLSLRRNKTISAQPHWQYLRRKKGIHM